MVQINLSSIGAIWGKQSLLKNKIHFVLNTYLLRQQGENNPTYTVAILHLVTSVYRQLHPVHFMEINIYFYLCGMF